MICSAVSDSFVICAWFLQRSWLSVSICLLFQSIWPFFSPFASNIHVVWWVLVLLLGWVSECFRWVVRNLTCRDILQSSVIWGCPSPMFLFHILVLVSSQQVFLQARQTVIAWAFGTVKSLFSEQVAFLAPDWILGAACVWPLWGFPSTDDRAATAGGQAHSWGVRESHTGAALGSVNCQDVWIKWFWPGHHYFKWVIDVSRLFIKIIGRWREGCLQSMD